MRNGNLTEIIHERLDGMWSGYRTRYVVTETPEDEILTARNKWLLPHPDSNEVKVGGCKVGLCGVNIDIADSI